MLNTVEPTNKSQIKSYVPKQLQSAVQVCLRDERKQSLLQKPYNGPSTILQRPDTTVTLDVKNIHKTIFIDRAKPLKSSEKLFALSYLSLFLKLIS